MAVVCLAAAGSTFAQEVEAPAQSGPIEIIRANDNALTCVQIADEAAQLSETMGGEPDGGLFGRIGGVAAAGAAMVIPGAGLVTAGVDALTRPERERKEAEAAAVRHRWYYLNGLYAGQDCMQAAEAATTPSPVAPAAPTPAPGTTVAPPSTAPAPPPDPRR